MTTTEILKDIKAKKFAPVYFLSGTETYYIDLINEALDQNTLSEAEKSFNLSLMYGKDSTPGQIIDTCLRLPMMAERQVVFVKEAQFLNKIESLEPYLNKPNPQTVLIVNYKKEKPEKSVEKIFKNAVCYHAAPMKDKDLPAWIDSYLSEKGYSITEKGMNMLVEFLGADLSKLSNELDKLIINKPDSKRIDDADIEKNIGISKDYNVFEYQKALASRNKLKVFQMVEYFSQNPKVAAMPAVTAIIWKFYTELYQVKAGAQLQQGQLAVAMGLSEKQVWLLKDLLYFSKLYTLEQIETCLETIHEYDMKSKGVGSSNMEYGEMLKEFSYKMMR